MNSETEVIDEALTHLVPSSLEEIKEDFKAAKTRKKLNNNTKYMLRKYENQKLDNEKTRFNYDRDICLKLKDLKQDFIPLFQIYNILTDKEKAYRLKNFFIIKKNGESSKLKDEIDEYLEEPVIELKMCLLYDDDKYYFKFVKGILNLMDSNLEDSYKRQYSLTQYIDDKNGKNKYDSDKLAFKNYCIAILQDINRILNECELNKENYLEKESQTNEKEFFNKMPEEKFQFLIKKSGLKYDNVLSNIFTTANNNDNILLEVKKLFNNDKEKYFELKGYLEEYLEINEIKNNNNELNQTIKSMEKIMNEQHKKLAAYDKTVKDQNNQLELQSNDISGLKNKIKNLSDENGEIKEKLKFMEIIVKASLSRKVINHCLNNIITKYKDCITVETNNKNESFKIVVVKDINNVSVKDSNDLINSLFEKKDYCNNFVHFDGIKKPDFIEDIWDVVLNFILLTKEETENFNKIITKDIKDSFKFSQKDEPINIKNKK